METQNSSQNIATGEPTQTSIPPSSVDSVNSTPTNISPNDEAISSLTPSKDEFMNAVISCGYPEPTEAQYNSFVNGMNSDTFSSKREVAMFLAQIMWESAGLTKKIEDDCQSKCGDYASAGDPPGSCYCGRGYIQLSWSYNYKPASEALFNDDRLYTSPDQVATDEDTAWGVSFWFWKQNVHSNSGVQSGQFGSSTNIINGGLECGANSSNGLAQKRFDLYTKVLPAFGINEAPNPAGC